MRVLVTDSARSDLAAVSEQLGGRDHGRAAHVIEDALDCCQHLGDFPESYPIVPRYEAQGVRRRVHGQLLIFYRQAAEGVEVLHIAQGARETDRLLFPDA